MSVSRELQSEPTLAGIDHISLSVRDLDRSRRWYCDVLGFQVVRNVEREGFSRSILQQQGHPAVFGLTEHHANVGARFSTLGAGLDHLAFRVESSHDLGRWRERLDGLGIAYSTPSGNLLVIRDPDGIQLELYAP